MPRMTVGNTNSQMRQQQVQLAQPSQTSSTPQAAQRQPAVRQKRSAGLGLDTGMSGYNTKITWGQKVRTTVKNSLREPSFVIPTLLIIFVVMFVRAYYVPSGSMIPTLIEGDRIFSLAKYFPDGQSYDRGDIVTFMSPSDVVYVKRVIGVGGDTIRISGDTVYVNDEPSEWQGTGTGAVQGVWELADDEYFVMGDNRSNSQDSRYIGPIKADKMISHVVAIYYPVGHMQVLLSDDDKRLYLMVIGGTVAVLVLFTVVTSIRRNGQDKSIPV